MAVIELSAVIQGTSSTIVGSQLAMALAATLRGRSSSLTPGSAQQPPQEPEKPKNEQG
jgi:hypothetical protein